MFWPFLFALVLAVCCAIPNSRCSPLERRANGGGNMIFALHMVGNTYPYAIADWQYDMKLASMVGIDGFALNIGLDEFQVERIADAYEAASQLGTGFLLYLSFDMTLFPCGAAADGQKLMNMISKYAQHPNQFIVGGKPFLSTFTGESCTFGQSSPAAGWQAALGGSTFFVPGFFGDPIELAPNGLINAIDGEFNWNAAWPNELTPDTYARFASEAEPFKFLGSLQGSTAAVDVTNMLGSMWHDDRYIANLAGKLYMASMSPWFFTHYPNSKNFVYLSDNVYPTRWQSVVEARDRIPLINILTWNDYGESTYVGPIEGDQPDSDAWATGFPHYAFLHMTKYFATAYKTGSYPAITQDVVYLWMRPHPKDAQAPDPNPKPTNYELFQDALFIAVQSTGDCELYISTSSMAQPVGYSVAAGFYQFSVPLVGGDSVRAVLARNGQTVIDVHPNITFNASPSLYNYNMFATFACSGEGGSCMW